MSVLHVAASNGYEEDCRMIINTCRYWTNTIPALATAGWNNSSDEGDDDDASIGSTGSANSLSSRSKKNKTTKQQSQQQQPPEDASSTFTRQSSNTSSISAGSGAAGTITSKNAGSTTTKVSVASITTKQPTHSTKASISSKDADKDKDVGDDSSVGGGSVKEKLQSSKPMKSPKTKPAPPIFCKMNNIVNFRQRSMYPYRGTPKQRNRVRSHRVRCVFVVTPFAQRGDTALTLAARRGMLDVIKVLVECGGADPNMAGAVRILYSSPHSTHSFSCRI
jgi:hypothetical protein